ncbi:MAG: hypothetical protein D6727_12385 [Gammaproteobacteria bacterium]|nr:MAG: hypothetical protein D6727_12385 [Gammaproteobacteria bacterium]
MQDSSKDSVDLAARRTAAVSLAGAAARREWRRFRALPRALRAPQRCRPLGLALARYALEPLPDGRPRPAASARERLHEFLPVDDGWWLFGWLAEQQRDEAWREPGELAALLTWCLSRPLPAGGLAG